MREAPILITGGAGFIGSALVRHLVLDRGERVVTLDALTYAGHLASLGDAAHAPTHQFEHGDVGDATVVDRVLRRHLPRAVLHLAAETHVDRSIDGPLAFVRTNVAGTCTLLEQVTRFWRSLSASARAAFRFVHVSTDEVFGALGADGAFTADSPYRPNSPYAASKAAADHFARAWHTTYGLPTVVTNCSNNYGPRQYPEKLIPLVVRKALAGESIPVYGRGDQVRDWLHVDDHVRGLVAALDRGLPGATYLFGGGAECTNLALVERVCDAVDALVPGPVARRSLITHVTDRPGHDFRYAIDASHAARALGWRPTITLPDGLRDTVSWYVEHAAWSDLVMQGAYRGERLGHPVSMDVAA